ncbi:B-box zinc finger protein 21-like [Phalaenopsis equestris]|uniref:B-box zinc finger protein 21-like n=1 Tax=Phalaenopsis equestris TaxID=78828 RepID=UPI0009E63148|nr:B-box zinc finger protein 21-like [Phalaenopsis equestris]
MKLQCDVCGVETASVLCYADEAALCRRCDEGVHSANKLAGKHRRVFLLPHPLRTLPLCDICKEKKGFVFCQDERAILCKDCDFQIHATNTNTSKHMRFLFSGIRLSTTPIPSAFSSTTENDNSCRSTISDYLMNMLPGWRVDDFLFDDVASTGNFSGCHLISEKAGETQTAGSELAKMEDVPVRVSSSPATQGSAMAQERLCALVDTVEWGRNEWNEEVFMVPQIQYQHTSEKRFMASFL